MTRRAHRVFGFVALVVTLGAVVWGFVLVGSPDQRRLERLDERRLQDLRRIVQEINMLVYDRHRPKVLKKDLPAALEAMEGKTRNWKLSLRDPETGEPYGYVVKSATTYEVCARFDRPRDDDSEAFWNHPAGWHCFLIDALNSPW
jgi:hypothetical protein